VSAGTDPARYPIANQQPRIITARVATKSVIATIDSTLLDVMLTLDQSTVVGATGAYTETGEDWMTRMLQSDAFIKLPPADIQRLLQTLRSVPVSAGDVIIRQGDEGDYFYLISRGVCRVTRQPEAGHAPVELAQLKAGQGFGEEAWKLGQPKPRRARGPLDVGIAENALGRQVGDGRTADMMHFTPKPRREQLSQLLHECDTHALPCRIRSDNLDVGARPLWPAGFLDRCHCR